MAKATDTQTTQILQLLNRRTSTNTASLAGHADYIFARWQLPADRLTKLTSIQATILLDDLLEDDR